MPAFHMGNFFKRERQFSQTKEKRLTALNQFCQQAFTEPLCVSLFALGAGE